MLVYIALFDEGIVVTGLERLEERFEGGGVRGGGVGGGEGVRGERVVDQRFCGEEDGELDVFAGLD